jgi:hypothetical protein
MSKHTHRGHCQVCGAQQAVDNKTGKLAKHGYTVESGWFTGECPGSHNLPLEHDHTMTDNIIGDLTRQADRIEQRIAGGIKNITLHYTVTDGSAYGKIEKTATVTIDTVEQVFAEIGKRFYNAEYQWDELVERETWRLERQVTFLRDHCEFMGKLIEKRHGADLVPVERIERIAKDFADHADAHEWVQSMKADGWKGRITINRNVSFGHPKRNTAQLRRTV